MTIYKGSQKIDKVNVGGTKIGNVYKGATQVYSDQLHVYNIYSTNQEKTYSCGFFLGEPGANKTVVGGESKYTGSSLLTGVIGTITSIRGTPGTTGSSLTAKLAGSNTDTFSFQDNYTDSYGGVWYRYKYTGFGTKYFLVSPFHTSVGSQCVYVDLCESAVFSSDASTITINYTIGGSSVYNAASTLRGTFQYN